MKDKKNNKAQSEMVGFGLIIIIVAIVLLIFLSISFKKSNNDLMESYEVDAYLQSILTYTTECAEDYVPDYYNLRQLIFACSYEKQCLDGTLACDVLNKTLSGLIESSWKVGEIYPYKGYLFNITKQGDELMGFQKGNITNTNKGASQSFEDGIDILLIVYN